MFYSIESVVSKSGVAIQRLEVTATNAPMTQTRFSKFGTGHPTAPTVKVRMPRTPAGSGSQVPLLFPSNKIFVSLSA